MKTLDVNAAQPTSYCIPLWLRDQQVEWAIKNVKGRVQSSTEKRSKPIAIASFGPSLAKNWEKIKDYKHVMTCSGSHKFLVERGIIPNFHLEVDPREHKVKLIGPPCKETEYLIASTCHKAVFDHLKDFNLKIWHVFDNDKEAFRVLPNGEWAILGGASVGLRCMTMARFLGFTEMDVFGMDGNIDDASTGSHAAEHPNSPPSRFETEYNGVKYLTTPSLLEVARQTWHELNQMPDANVRFHGEGLVQAMAKDYVRQPPIKGNAVIAIQKPELISATYRDLNHQLHVDNPAYGVGAEKYAPTVIKLCEEFKTTDCLDYGAGKRRLGRALPFHIAEYDPAIPEIAESPKPANIVLCFDTLEHVEPDKINAVLEDLKRCVKTFGYFIIHTREAGKSYANGENTHLIQRGRSWWESKLAKRFKITKIIEADPHLHVMVTPLEQNQSKAA